MLNLKTNIDGEVELTINGVVIEGRHSRLFNYAPVDGDFYLFEDEEEALFGLISALPITQVPGDVQFEFYKANYETPPKAIAQLPDPFNVLNFYKSRQGFLVRFSAVFDEDSWKGPWPADIYFSEFTQYVKQQNDVAIKEQEGFSLEEGKLIFEFSPKNATTVLEAYQEALSRLKDIIKHTEAGLYDGNGIDLMMTQWQAYKSNHTEAAWRDLIANHTYTVSQLFESPLLMMDHVGYLAGVSLDKPEADLANFVLHHDLLDKMAFLKVKTPDTPLLGQRYKESYSLATELTGPINQLLHYKYHFTETLAGTTEINGELKHFNPPCRLIIGSLDALTDYQLASFNHFREQLKTVQIYTFEEFFKSVEQYKNKVTYKQKGSEVMQNNK